MLETSKTSLPQPGSKKRTEPDYAVMPIKSLELLIKNTAAELVAAEAVSSRLTLRLGAMLNAAKEKMPPYEFREWAPKVSGKAWSTCRTYMSLAKNPETLETYYAKKRDYESTGRYVTPLLRPASYHEPAAMRERRIKFAVQALIYLTPEEFNEVLQRAMLERKTIKSDEETYGILVSAGL